MPVGLILLGLLLVAPTLLMTVGYFTIAFLSWARGKVGEYL